MNIVGIPRGYRWETSWGLDRLVKTVPRRVYRLFMRHDLHIKTTAHGNLSFTTWKRIKRDARKLP